MVMGAVVVTHTLTGVNQYGQPPYRCLMCHGGFIVSINLTSHNDLLTANPGAFTCTWLCTDMHGGDVLTLMPHFYPDALVAA
jgi:hypothetical protein